MNPQWLGDSYDIVKKFFVDALKGIGYEVYVEPMFTGDWKGGEQQFFEFLGAKQNDEYAEPHPKSALLFDPDTGIGKKASSKHVTISSIIKELRKYEIVFSFDQSFSRGIAPEGQMQEKLAVLDELGGIGFYYNSHARFLFAAKNLIALDTLRDKLIEIGLPAARLVTKKAT